MSEDEIVESRAKKAAPYLETYKAWAKHNEVELNAGTLEAWDAEHNSGKIRKMISSKDALSLGYKTFFNRVFYAYFTFSAVIEPEEINTPEFTYTPLDAAKKSVSVSAVTGGKLWTDQPVKDRTYQIETAKEQIKLAASKLVIYGLTKKELKEFYQSLPTE